MDWRRFLSDFTSKMMQIVLVHVLNDAYSFLSFLGLIAHRCKVECCCVYWIRLLLYRCANRQVALLVTLLCSVHDANGCCSDLDKISQTQNCELYFEMWFISPSNNSNAVTFRRRRKVCAGSEDGSQVSFLPLHWFFHKADICRLHKILNFCYAGLNCAASVVPRYTQGRVSDSSAQTRRYPFDAMTYLSWNEEELFSQILWMFRSSFLPTRSASATSTTV